MKHKWQTITQSTFWKRVWHNFTIVVMLTVGAILGAWAYAVFQMPDDIVSGGLSGISLIINNFTGWPVGLTYFVLNTPLLILGYYNLGRWRFVVRTMYTALIFSIALDVFAVYLPVWMSDFPLSDDLLLNSIYAGIVGGISGGIVYRAGSTFGGTGIIARIVQQRTGLPLSQAFFFSDGVIILAAGLVFGWHIALYGFLVLFLQGIASDYTLEGPSSTRTATIVTDHPRQMSEALMAKLDRGVSYWKITGAYSRRQRYMVTCTMYRSQVNAVKRVVAEIDPASFLTIGISHRAMGEGFEAGKNVMSED
jgi:uncharacterized membrane-anchored protein YitT (DUF2179 family)